MRIRVIDLDGSITAQERVLRMFQPDIIDVRHWGPRLRLGCRWNRFYRYERRLDRLLGAREQLDPWVSLLGSGEFQHLTLAHLRRVRHPFNLLVLDNHPGWTRGVPILHRGGWLRHAAGLPNLRRIFHLGGDKNFDNACRWLAPKALLENGKIVLLPAVRTFETGFWRHQQHKSLRANFETPIDHERLEELLWPHLDELERLPLYISLDKDVMWMPESVANSDSGFLDLAEVLEIMQFFLKAAGNELIGMDIVGDWSPVRTQGVTRRLLHRFGHSQTRVDAEEARLCNERTNTMLLRFLMHDPVEAGIAFRARLMST